MIDQITYFITLTQTWLAEHALIVVGILFGTWILSKFMNGMLTRIIRKTIPRGSFVSKSEEVNCEKENLIFFIFPFKFGNDSSIFSIILGERKLSS